ncbi:MAG: HisA/HisF-related TIM barrel protein [Fuerstiella sp.]
MTQIYDIHRSWQWNLEHAPEPAASCMAAPLLAPLPGRWTWCGIPVASPLGMPAGPLLNGRWVLHYARLGFDILVYKTVRSSERPCYPLPNLVPVKTDPLQGAGRTVPAATEMDGSWAVSFGMPSQSPDVWRRDVEQTRQQLSEGQVLVVSVVGTQDESLTDPDASLEQLADDFATCARWAMDSGAHGVEANFSCPNVATADGQLFQHPQAAAKVARRIRDAIGPAPLVLKIGKVSSAKAVAELLQHVGPLANGLAMTNSISARVSDTEGNLLFDGQPRGICGAATRATSVAQTRLFRQALQATGLSLDLIGVGGISTTAHVREYLEAGATSVAVASAAMRDPELAQRIRHDFTRTMANRSSSGPSGSRP